MKVLLRSDYKWHDVTYDMGKDTIFEALPDTSSKKKVYECDIISIQDDDRQKYLTCANCGTIIFNDPKEIRKHLALSHSSKACFGCRLFRQIQRDEISSNIQKQKDGRYILISKKEVGFICGKGSYYSRINIDSPQARQSCMYANCTRQTLQPLSRGIFDDYPDPFEDVVTIDALNKEKWQFEENYGDHFIFAATGKIRLLAHVNNKGIIRHFKYIKRNRVFRFVYSPKYEQIFWFDYYGDIYKTTNDDCSEAALKTILNKVKEVYKEVK